MAARIRGSLVPARWPAWRFGASFSDGGIGGMADAGGIAALRRFSMS